MPLCLFKIFSRHCPRLLMSSAVVFSPALNILVCFRLFGTTAPWNKSFFRFRKCVNISQKKLSCVFFILRSAMTKGQKFLISSNGQKTCCTKCNGRRNCEVGHLRSQRFAQRYNFPLSLMSDCSPRQIVFLPSKL